VHHLRSEPLIRNWRNSTELAPLCGNRAAALRRSLRPDRSAEADFAVSATGKRSPACETANDSAPNAAAFGVDLDEHLIKVPAPLWPGSKPVRAYRADSCGKTGPKPLYSKPDRPVADVDAALVQKILDTPQRQRKAHIEHNCEANDLGAAVKLFERVGSGHEAMPRGGPARLNRIASDKARAPVQLSFAWSEQLSGPGVMVTGWTLMRTIQSCC
jgi:hypothetical protein